MWVIAVKMTALCHREEQSDVAISTGWPGWFEWDCHGTPCLAMTQRRAIFAAMTYLTCFLSCSSPCSFLVIKSPFPGHILFIVHCPSPFTLAASAAVYPSPI